MDFLLHETAFETSEVVANARTNRQRNLNGGNGYQRELGVDLFSFLQEHLTTHSNLTTQASIGGHLARAYRAWLKLAPWIARFCTANPEACALPAAAVAVGGIIYARIQLEHALDAKDRANAQLMEILHKYNELMLARKSRWKPNGKPNGNPDGSPSLAGRYTIERPRYDDGGRDDDCDKQWIKARKFCAEVGAIPRSAPEWKDYKDIWGGATMRVYVGR